MTPPTTAATEATTGEQLTADGVLEVRSLLGARLSPTGDQVVYAVSAPPAERHRDRAQLCVVDVATGESRALTEPCALDVAPSWHPDGDTIVFRSTRYDGEDQVLAVPAAGGEPRALTRLEGGVGPLEPRVSPDGRRVLFGARARPPRDPAEPYRVTSMLWRLEPVGLLRDAAQELFLVDMDGGDPEQVTDHGELILATEWSPDGDRVLYMTLGESDEPAFTLRVWDAETGQSTALWEGDYEVYPPVAAWGPDGGIVRSTTNRVCVSCERLQLVRTDAVPDAPESPRTAGVDGWIFGVLQSDFEFGPFVAPRIVVAPDGREAFVAVQVGWRYEVWAVGLEGEPSARPIVRGDQASVPFDADADRLLVATSTMHSPPDLWLVDRDGGGARRLTSLNEERFPAGARFDARPLVVRGEDGTPVEAWFLRPHGTDGPIPTLLTIHGGPHGAWGHTFSYDNCLLTEAGYGILLVNPRGSTGYSEEFGQSIHGHLGEQEADDLLCAVDAAVAEGLADPDALGVWGLSGGGTLTAWLVTHSDRFRAGVAECGVFDWAASWCSDMGWLFAEWLRERPTSPLPDAAAVARQSTTSFAGNCTTPILIIQHEQDLRVPSGNGDGLFTLLKLHGCPTEMLRMPGSPHGGSVHLGDPRTRVVQNEAVRGWFDQHLRRRPV